MKPFIVTLFFLTSSLTSAETWIEIIVEANPADEKLNFFQEIGKKDSDLFPN